jgi:predicted enzyme related to lactoylglutathione lyase
MTDVSAAQHFYGKVVGWDVQDTSTSEFAYRLFSVGGTPVAGRMELPLDGWKRGATPRWVGYIPARNPRTNAPLTSTRCPGQQHRPA